MIDSTIAMNSSSSTNSAEYLPSIWQDDKRMNAMFADFRHGSVNPVDFDKKMSFWSDAVTNWLETKGCITFTLFDARKAFTRRGSIPLCLDAVLTEISKQGTIMTMADFLKYVSNPGWLSWSMDLFIKKPVSYTWYLISGAIMTSRSDDSLNYVNITKLKETTNGILTKYRDISIEETAENPVLFTTLHKKCSSICPSESDLDLCLLWLQREGLVTIHNEQQCKVVRFLNGPQKPVTNLTKTEKAVIQLGLVKKRLENQIDIHLANIDKCVAEAREHLRANLKPAAKAALLKKKQIEKSLLEKETTLENVEGLLERLQDVHTQKAVIEALQIGADAFKQNGELDIDKVDDTMAEVAETLDMQNEIQDALGTPVQLIGESTSLEEELDAILLDANPTANGRALESTFYKGSKVMRKTSAERLSEDMKHLSFSDVEDLPSPPKEFDFGVFNRKEKVGFLRP